ncbi:oligosaccharide repeat unit polymerase [Flavobacterium gawalongense]|uniref:Oligosaccharide repeat unit polymerase n=2 Tax=Flavobacterium gawalongense TaxID=2594432 RepID=A0ABY3CQ26_9FLAO|nr:O-antigen polymerase [Flavobacterium gawalongense]TRX04455.1 oligosaccharide repeat unit polymerase [Flavobacterium gawalongense]TRX10345.1 oligosaccharide repeat unit polymerase [Flavobacterium gawalongense]
MSLTVPVFLLFVDEITVRLFSSFVATQLLFFIGFWMFSPIKVDKIYSFKKKKINLQEIRFIKWFFIVIGFTNIILQLFSYKLVGIPLLAESRLGIYGESGGINNLLKRILDVTFQSHIFLTIFFIYFQKKSLFFKIYTNLSVLLIVAFSVLSGSKGAFMSFGLAFFIYALYAIRWGDFSLFFAIKKFIIKFGVVALIIAMVVISLSEGSGNPLIFLLLRIGQSGDVYYMAYPNNIIDKIPTVNWFIALFGGPLSLLKIIPRTMVPEPMGYFIMQYHNPTVEFRGPNARMNVFSYVYFGIIYSPIYCFFIGAVFSFFRNKLFYLLPANIFGCIVYFLFLNAALKLETDFQTALADFINILVILPFFIFISYYLSLRKINE